MPLLDEHQLQLQSIVLGIEGMQHGWIGRHGRMDQRVRVEVQLSTHCRLECIPFFAGIQTEYTRSKSEWEEKKMSINI